MSSSMVLRTENYTFGVFQYVDEDDYGVELSIGGTNTNPRPCVRISMGTDNCGKTWSVVVQDVVYQASCASGGLPRKIGTVEMVQGALSAIVNKWTGCQSVYLTDNSIIERGRIPLPELRAFLGRKSWYEEKLGAVTSDASRQEMWARYKVAARRRVEHWTMWESLGFVTGKGMTLAQTIQTNFERMDATVMCAIIRKLHLAPLTGGAYSIPLLTIHAYPFSGEFIQSGGGRDTRNISVREAKQPFDFAHFYYSWLSGQLPELDGRKGKRNKQTTYTTD